MTLFKVSISFSLSVYKSRKFTTQITIYTHYICKQSQNIYISWNFILYTCIMGYHEQWHVFDITPYCHTSKSNMLSLLPMDHKFFCKIQALHNRITCPPPPFWYSLAFKNVFESWSSPIAMVHNKIYSNILLHLYIRLYWPTCEYSLVWGWLLML